MPFTLSLSLALCAAIAVSTQSAPQGRPEAFRMLWIDLDANGLVDLVRYRTGGRAQILLNDPEGDLVPAPSEWEQQLYGIEAMIPADIDGDGVLELVVARDEESLVIELSGESPDVRFRLPGALDAAVVDVNQDMLSDITLDGRVFLQTETGGFTELVLPDYDGAPSLSTCHDRPAHNSLHATITRQGLWESNGGELTAPTSEQSHQSGNCWHKVTTTGPSEEVTTAAAASTEKIEIGLTIPNAEHLDWLDSDQFLRSDRLDTALTSIAIAGSLGVGKLRPAANLHVWSDSIASIRLEGRGGEGVLGETGMIRANGLQQQNPYDGGITLQRYFYDGSSYRSEDVLHVTGRGRVGILNGNPSADFEIRDRFAVNAALQWPDRWHVSLGDGTGWKGHFGKSDGSKLITLTDQGCLGIGTESPRKSLHVRGGPYSQVIVQGPTSGGIQLFEDGVAPADPRMVMSGVSTAWSIQRWRDESTHESTLLSVFDNGEVAVGNRRTDLGARLTVDGDIQTFGVLYGDGSGLSNLIVDPDSDWSINGEDISHTTGTVTTNNLTTEGTLHATHYVQVDHASPSQSMQVTNTGDGYGLIVRASTTVDERAAIYGEAIGGSGNTKGVVGTTNSPANQDGSAAGVWGRSLSPVARGASPFGVLGESHSIPEPGAMISAGTFGWGVVNGGGSDGDTYARTYGIWGETDSRGTPGGQSGVTAAVGGLAINRRDSHAVGVMGQTDDPSMNSFGVYYVGGIGGSGSVTTLSRTPDGPRALYAVMGASNWVQDIGEGRLEDGGAEISLDPVFLQVADIDDRSKLKVFVTFTGPRAPSSHVVHKRKDGFRIVTPNAQLQDIPFDWMVLAPRRGVTGKRLPISEIGRQDPNLYPSNKHDVSERIPAS